MVVQVVIIGALGRDMQFGHNHKDDLYSTFKINITSIIIEEVKRIEKEGKEKKIEKKKKLEEKGEKKSKEE
ncbi:hypothetical protein Tco_1406449 [Tanacetum coccineum]